MESGESENGAKLVGPMQMSAPLGSSALSMVYLAFKDTCFYVLTAVGKEIVTGSCAEISYSNVSNFARKREHVTVGLNDDPVWKDVSDKRVADFVKGGFRALVFQGEAKSLTKIAEVLYMKCPQLLVSDLVVVDECDASFVLPGNYQQDIEERIPEIAKSAKSENAFFDDFGFHFAMDSEVVAIEAINALVSPLILDSFQFRESDRTCIGWNMKFQAKLEWGGLSSEDAMKFPHAPSMVYAFRATAVVKGMTLATVTERLRTFMTVTNWERMTFVGKDGYLAYWMMKIHGREFWTTPAVSVELTTTKYSVVAFTMVPCPSFVARVHKLHPGRFKEGQGRCWLPEIYNSVFIIQREGAGVKIQYLELLGWNSDPELHQQTMGNLAMQICKVLPEFVSYLSVAGARI